jgi:hypothetical protein
MFSIHIERRFRREKGPEKITGTFIITTLHILEHHANMPQIHTLPHLPPPLPPFHLKQSINSYQNTRPLYMVYRAVSLEYATVDRSGPRNIAASAPAIKEYVCTK